MLRINGFSMRPSDKVRAILQQPQWTQQRVAAELGVSQSTINRWLKGAEPEGENRDNIGVLYLQLFESEGVAKVPLKGYVGAGQAIYPIDDGGDDLVDAPPTSNGSTVAVRVRGDSMLPLFEDGSLIYYSRHLPPGEMLNRRCVAKLADGRMLVKTLRRGAGEGFWTLTSTNSADIEDVVVEWVAPIDWIKPQ